jgi:hypothetical protein
MKIIEVPVFNEDGSITAVVHINPQESVNLLQFAVNYLSSTGYAVFNTVKLAQKEADPVQLELLDGPKTIN